ncbi:MAG: preprotein translocase subunit YajC [Hydrogenophilus sp.]|nr:preprotein translocase subunit YajC [Hydrogenophilus sp.]
MVQFSYLSRGGIFMFIAAAYAQATPQQPGAMETFVQLLPLIVMFLIIWFLMIRPQMKRAKEHKQMLAALKTGDEVLTQGGIAGIIRALDDQWVTLEIAKGVHVVVQKPTILALLVKGTLKHLD